MDIFSPEERAAFAEAASALLSTKERMELMEEQAAEQLGGQIGRVPIPREQVESVMAPGRNLLQILVEIKRKHPALPAVRFRGSLFALQVHNGQVLGLSMIREAEIETVEG